MKTNFVLLALFAVGCSSPTSPTVTKLPTNPDTAHKVPTTAPVSESTITPVVLSDRAISGPLTVGDKLVWRVTVNHTKQQFHVVTSLNHDDSRLGGGFIGRNGPEFRVVGVDTYAVNQSGEFTIEYNIREKTCGRVQMDASFIYNDGREEQFIGDLYRYATDCAPVVVPPCTVGCEPPPTPPLPPLPPVPPVPPTPPSNECRPNISNPSVKGNTATFTVAPNASVEVSFVSYTIASIEDFYHQKFYSGSPHGVFYGPGTHTLTIPVAGWFQADLYCGGYKDEDLTPKNWDYYAAKWLAGE